MIELVLTTALLCGDVNENGSVTATDALMALSAATNGDYVLEADVNSDGEVTAADALGILLGADYCPIAVTACTPEPVEAVTFKLDYVGDGPIGELADVKCTFNSEYTLGVAANHVEAPTHPHDNYLWPDGDHYLSVTAISLKPVVGEIVTCYLYSGTEVELTIHEACLFKDC